MAGRPTTYTQELADVICGLLAEGETLNAICRRDGMPAKSTVHLWRRKDPEFERQIQQAREIQAESWFDELIDIADDQSADWVDTDNGRALDREHVQRTKLRLETRMWCMSRAMPKKFSDKPHHHEPPKVDTGLLVEVVTICDESDDE